MTSLRPSYGSPGETKVSAQPDTSIIINQCLFGYDDGHRRLAASLKLPEEAASLLLFNSDLVPGLEGNRSDGYLTGYPIPSARAYALMRTWLAPEMPRPGCVWSHVLLITLSDMARFPDLAVLEALFTRPSFSAGYASYATTLSVDTISAKQKRSAPISPQAALQILRAIYGSQSGGFIPDDREKIDNAIFAVWSQQWPRLRRAFSFRTAGSVDATKSSFDLQVVRGPLPSISIDNVIDWEKAAIDDLSGSAPSHFRQFLWRYGSDIRRGRERFRFLAELFLTTRLSLLEGRNLIQILDKVVDVLPDANDGKLLKEDLLSCGQSKYSLLPAADPIDTLDYLVRHTNLAALPPPPETAFEAVHGLWSTRASEILNVAEKAVTEGSGAVENLLDRLSSLAQPISFLGISHDHPLIRQRLIRVNPSLLDSPDLASIPTQELSSLLSLLPDDQDLVARVLDRLVFLDNSDVAAIFTDRFLELTQVRVFEARLAEITGSGFPVPRVWAAAVRRHSPNLAKVILERAKTTTGLFALVSLLGHEVVEGLKVDPADWASALLRVDDDIVGQDRQKLLTYLLTLALARPAPGSEPLFERSFESVHADLSASRLPHEAQSVLKRFLPDLYWWQQWDTCLRLRRGVVAAYESGGLNPSSFRRLTNDSGLFSELVDIASDSAQGRRFLKRVFD